MYYFLTGRREVFWAWLSSFISGAFTFILFIPNLIGFFLSFFFSGQGVHWRGWLLTFFYIMTAVKLPDDDTSAGVGMHGTLYIYHTRPFFLPRNIMFFPDINSLVVDWVLITRVRGALSFRVYYCMNESTIPIFSLIIVLGHGVSLAELAGLSLQVLYQRFPQV